MIYALLPPRGGYVLDAFISLSVSLLVCLCACAIIPKGLNIALVRTHYGDAENFNSYFIFVSDRHYIHIFYILLMVICLFTDIISLSCCWEFIYVDLQ